MNEIITTNLKQINALCNKYNVNTLFAFGSVMTPDFNNESDIDLLISFNKIHDYGEYADNYFLLIEKLEKLFNRSVDLVTEKSMANPYFIKSVNKTKTLIYGN
ncbi:MAG: nucleotidyltransferase domain-containing protein [Bacteroidales bacterium]|nr:nucleotidyltransferase domain-containing protein [Bacteroidales bacterium]